MKEMRIRFCPKCGNTKIVFVAGGMTGMNECANCGYRSVAFPEKNIEEEIDFSEIEQK